MTKHVTIGAIRMAETRLKQYAEEVSEELWKRDHERVLELWAFESMLEHGTRVFKFLIDLDTNVRLALAKEEDGATDLAVLDQIRRLFQNWQKVWAHVERDIEQFEAQGFAVDFAEEFRKCHAECTWMLKPPSEAFANEKFVRLRDEAIDEARKQRKSR